jgi:hypothetical protein
MAARRVASFMNESFLGSFLVQSDPGYGLGIRKVLLIIAQPCTTKIDESAIRKSRSIEK